MVPSPTCPADETVRDLPSMAATHRVDPAHPPWLAGGMEQQTANQHGANQHGANELGANEHTAEQYGAEQQSERALSDRHGDPFDFSALGIYHAEDLLVYVQRLSEDVDARSARLHADIATHERRERAFRLWAQQRAQEIRHQQDQCRQQQARLQAQARRLAMTDGVTHVSAT